MLKNKIPRRLALLVSLLLLLTSTVNTTFGLIVTQTDSIVNTFTPFDTVINNLFIKKTVDHPLGDEYVIPDNISFDFKVELGSLYASTTVKTTSGEVVADENGAFTVSVKPGVPFKLEGIDAGTKVTLTELQREEGGFTVKDGLATMDAVIAEDGGICVEFVNVYTPLPVSPSNIDVNGVKILEGREWQEGDAFTFTLEQLMPDGTCQIIGSETVSYDKTDESFNSFSFSEEVHSLVFDTVGTYELRITELKGELPNVCYDESVNTVTVKVTDVDMDGSLEIGEVSASDNVKVTETDGRFTLDVTFNNTFVPPPPPPDDITVDFRVDKEVKINSENDVTVSREGFEFILENVLTGEKSAFFSDAEGAAQISLSFTASDVGKTYEYKLFERNVGAENFVYDDKVYSVTLTVEQGDDNTLKPTVSVDGKLTESVSVRFVNVYTPGPVQSPPTSDFGFVLSVSVMILSGLACIALVFLDKKYSHA